MRDRRADPLNTSPPFAGATRSPPRPGNQAPAGRRRRPVKPRRPRADAFGVTSARALSLLAHAASAVFLAAEVAGWVLGWWPATPLTFTVSLAVVAVGPVVGMLHVATAREAAPPEPAPARPAPRVVAPRPAAARRVTAPRPAPVPPRLAAARRFHAWRDGAPVRQ
jgi:uncharacterized membrane protein